MDKDELISFLKENLELDFIDEQGCYGEGGYKSIQLKLNDEVISEVDLT